MNTTMISAKYKLITVAVILCAMVCVNAQKFGDKIKKANTNAVSTNNNNNNNNNNTKNNSNGLKEVAVSASQTQPKRKQVSNAGKRPSDKKHANNKGYAEVKVYQYSMSHSDQSDDMLPLNQQQINYRVNDPNEFERQFQMIASNFPKTAASDHYQIPVYKAPKAPKAPNAPKIEFIPRNFEERHDDNQQRHHNHQPHHQQNHQQRQHNHQPHHHQQHNNHRQQQQHDNYHQNHQQNHHQPQPQHHHQDSHHQQQQQYHQPQQTHHQQQHHNNHHQQQQHSNHKNNRNNNYNQIQTNSGLSFDIPRGFPHPNDDKRAQFKKQLMGEQNREGKPWGAQMSYSYRDPKNPKNYVEVKEMHVNVNKENAMSPQESANQLQKLLQASQGNTYGLFASRPFDGQNPFNGRPSNVIAYNDDVYGDNDDVDHDEPKFPF